MNKADPLSHLIGGVMTPPYKKFLEWSYNYGLRKGIFEEAC